MVGKMKVSALLEAHARRRQGPGRARSWRSSASRRRRRVRGLGANQVAALEREFGCCGRASVSEPSPARRPAHRPLRALRRRQGHASSAHVRAPHPEVWLSVSATTRAPRPGEVDGVHYHFVDRRRVRPDGRGGRAARVGRVRAATATARRARRSRSGSRRAGRCCWRSTCRARARSGEPMPEALLVFLAPPSLGRAGPPADRPGHRGPAERSRRRLSTRASRAGRRGGVRRDASSTTTSSGPPTSW